MQGRRLGGEHERRVELREHGDGRAQAQASQEARRETESVEEGEDAVEDLGTLVEDGYPRNALFHVVL